MMKKGLILIAIMMALVSVVSAQGVLTQIFKINAEDATWPWFGLLDQTRGLGYNPTTQHVLVADRDSTYGNKVHILSATDGSESGQLDSSAYTVGTHVVGKVAATSDAIYVSNLAVAGANYRIYKHTDEAAVATTAYDEAGVAARLGDELTVTGSGTSTKIAVTGWQSAALSILTTADGNTFTKNTVSPASPDFVFGGTAAGYTNIAWDTNATDYFACKTVDANATPTVYLYNGTTNTSNNTSVITSTVQAGGAGAIDVKQVGTLKMLAVAPGNIAAAAVDCFCEFYNASTGAQLGFRTGAIEKTGAGNANLNGTGEVVIDVTGNRVFILNTNNSISAWSLPGSGESDWNLF